MSKVLVAQALWAWSEAGHGMHLSSHCWKVETRRLLEACRTASAAEAAIFWLSERPCLKRLGWRAIEEDTWCLSLAVTHSSRGEHTCTETCTHISITLKRHQAFLHYTVEGKKNEKLLVWLCWVWEHVIRGRKTGHLVNKHNDQNECHLPVSALWNLSSTSDLPLHKQMLVSTEADQGKESWA